MAKTKKFEYMNVPLWKLKDETNYICSEKLDEFGRQGWELTVVMSGEAIFKRER